MEDDDLAGRLGSRTDAAHQLGLESLDSYSRAELATRVTLLETEILRVTGHALKSASHRLVAEALFGPRSAATAPGSGE